MSLLSEGEENLAKALEKDGKRTPASDLFRELSSPVFRYLYVKSGKKTDGEINSALIRETKEAQHALDEEGCQKRIEQVIGAEIKKLNEREDELKVLREPLIKIMDTRHWTLDEDEFMHNSIQEIVEIPNKVALLNNLLQALKAKIKEE